VNEMMEIFDVFVCISAINDYICKLPLKGAGLLGRQK